MQRHSELYDAHQRVRFMRPDAARWMRPDAARWIRPDVARFLIPGTDPKDVFPALQRKYNPSQPRVPAGNGRPSGRWTDGREGVQPNIGGPEGPIDLQDIGGPYDGNDLGNLESGPSDTESQAELIQIADGKKPILDEFGEPYYKPGGHHEMPKSIYEKWELTPETRQVFEESTTGTLPRGRVIASPDGEMRGHFWDEPHRQYKDAVQELSERFLRDYDVVETQRMTPDQARDLLSEIRKSENPLIRDFNSTMRLIGRNFRLRFGRGNQ